MPGTVEAAIEFLNKANERARNGGTVILNVGGKIHQVRWETIDKFPKSRLQKIRYATSEVEILSLCDSYSLQRREFYFDRSPRIFENILGLYRKGELHLTERVCPRDFLGELEYWGLSALHLEPCCAYTLQRASWLLPIVNHGIDTEDEINYFEGKRFGNLRFCLWKLFEDPDSSTPAKVLAIVDSVFLITSIFMLILSTIPQFQETKNQVNYKDVVDSASGDKDESYFFGIMETIFVGWFTFIFAVRLLLAPDKVQFFMNFLNIIDLFGILPFFISVLLNLLNSQYSFEWMAKAAQIFRILRILRIFKLSRHITGLKTLGLTLRNSHRELLLLTMTVSMGMLIFAGLAYALEKDEPDTTFYTLPQTLYWAIITMTSTGYGDVAPRTAGGKFIGSLCAICGVLCITLPIPIIVTNFNRYYEKSIIEQAINEERNNIANNWEETKQSIRDARYRLSLSTQSESLDHDSKLNKILDHGDSKLNKVDKLRTNNRPLTQ